MALLATQIEAPSLATPDGLEIPEVAGLPVTAMPLDANWLSAPPMPGTGGEAGRRAHAARSIDSRPRPAPAVFHHSE